MGLHFGEIPLELLVAAGPGRASRRRAESPIRDPAPLVWRAPEGPEGLAAGTVGGGRAWPGFETTRRAKLAARTARGRAAAHGHTKQPGPTRQATRRPEIRRGHKQHKQESFPTGRHTVFVLISYSVPLVFP